MGVTTSNDDTHPGEAPPVLPAPARASGTDLAPPRLLSRPAEPPPPPPPLAGSEQVGQLHRRWAQLHGAPAGGESLAPQGSEPGPAGGAAPPRIPGGVRAKVRAKVATAAAGVQQADRAMTGDLIQAVDTLARRIDEITTRVTDLEALVQDVVETLSEDLVRLQLALATHGGGEAGTSTAAGATAADETGEAGGGTGDP